MVYSFHLITLPSQCDSLIAISERDKRTLEARRQSLTVRAENSALDVQDNAIDLISLNAQLSACLASLANLPEGPNKEKEITKKMDLELKIRRANEDDNRLSTVSQLLREYDVELLDAQIAKMEDFIAAVIAHKATLH